MGASRAERAKLLGHPSAEHYRLDDEIGEDARRGARPASIPSGGYARAQAMDAPARPCRNWLQEEGGNFRLAPWDWRYYAEKLRKRRCDIDEGAIKPYLQLDRIIAAAFHAANKLFGLTFEPRVTTCRPGIPDVRV